MNWYGRIIFGIVANLAMTHDQLTDVRKYWLGRVIAFDSLRRQRQNQLARMHLQLAAKVKAEAQDKKILVAPLGQIALILKKLFLSHKGLVQFRLRLLFHSRHHCEARPWHDRRKQGFKAHSASQRRNRKISNVSERISTTANTFDGRDEIYEPE